MEKMDFSKFGYGKVADHIEELKDIVGPENVMTAMHDRAMRAASCAPFPMQRWEDHIPDVVVRPGSTEEVSEVMKLANKYKLPVVPRGAGCGLADGAFPLNKGICLDMKRMNEILEVDDINRTVTVQPGVNMQELNKVLDKVGMYYPDDPASYGTAVIGGRIGTNGWSVGGAGSGHPANLVCSMEVVLPTGEVVWLGKGGSRKCRNSSAGYRMLELFFGHQGTLGVVTEAVLDCCPKPEVEFPSYYGFASYEEAYNALYQIGISGVKCAVNYIMFDDEKIDFLRRDDEAFIPLPESVKCVVMATFAGTEGEVLAARKKILGIMKKMKGTYLGEEQAWGDWATRHDRYHLAVHCRDGQGQVVTMSWHCEDNCMIHSELPEFTHGLHKIVKKYVDKYDNIFNDAGCFIYCGGPYRTWGDYLAEVDVFINEYAMTPELWEVWLDMKREIAELAVDLGGSISICHGACREGDVDVLIEKELVDGQFEMMKKIKKLFDPNNIMNPGKYRLDLAY